MLYRANSVDETYTAPEIYIYVLLRAYSGPEVINLSCSTQLSMKNFLLINVKMPTMVGILTFMSRKIAF